MILGISGKKQSGKDLAYQIINSELIGKKATRRYAFADEVKRLSSKYFGYTEPEKEKYRFVLQGVGQMFRDEVDRLFWVNRVVQQIKIDVEEFSSRGVELVAVITDVRYRNEAEEIIAQGGKLLRIERPLLTTNPVDTHPSEIDLDEYHFTNIVVNDKDKKHYIRKIREVCQRELL